MPKNHVLKCVVTKELKEKALYDARMNGFVTVSAYIRDYISKGSLNTQIYDSVKKIERKVC